MSSFDGDLDAVSRRISAYMATPASRRSPDELVGLHAELDRLRSYTLDTTKDDLGGLRAIHVRHLENVEARLSQVERILTQKTESEQRVAAARRKTAGTATGPWTRLRTAIGIGRPRSNPMAAERDRFVAGVGLVIAVAIGCVGAALATRRETAEAASRASSAPAAAPEARRLALTSDEVAELVRKRASADFQAQHAPPEMRPAAVFRDSRRRKPDEAPDLPPGEIAIRIGAMKDAFVRASQCAVTRGADERTVPDLAHPVLVARREFHKDAANLARVAPRAGADGAAFFLDLACDPDPVLSSIGRQCLGLARSPEVDGWLADSLRSGTIPPSDTAIESAVERGGDDLHDAILTLARSGDRVPHVRRLALQGLVRLGRCDDALGLLPLTGDPSMGHAVGHAAAELARRASQAADDSLVGAIALEIRNTSRRPAPLVEVAAAMGGSGIEILQEEAQSVDPHRRRAVLDAVAAWPTRAGVEVVATLVNDCDHVLSADARKFLATARPATPPAAPPKGSSQAPQ